MPYSFNPLSGLGLDQSIPLDGAGKIPSDYLPSYVDDVVEYANLAGFPATGETGKIYVAIDTGFTYRWSGSVYIQINSLTGAFAANAGTAAAPSISIGTADNGLYAPAEDQVGISTNGTGRLFVASSGRVGVGSVSAEDLFEVSEASDGSVGPVLSLRNSTDLGGVDSGAEIRFNFRDTASTRHCVIGAANGDTFSRSGYIYFKTNSGTSAPVEHLRITSTGALNFVGAGTAGSTQAVSFNGSAPVNSLVIDSTGKVGLGSSDPNELFEIAASASHRISVRATDATMSDGGDYGGFCWYTNDNSNPNRKNWEIYQKASGSTGTTDLHINSFSTNDIVVIDVSGNVGIGTTSPASALNVSKAGAEGYEFIPGDSSNVNRTQHYNRSSSAYIVNTSRASEHTWEISATGEKARIDSSGRLLVGTSTARAVESSFGNAAAPRLQVEGNDGASSQILITDTRSDGRNPSLAFAKTRNGAIVTSGDVLGSLSFFGDDGIDTRAWGGRITCEVDGTPGADDMPGRLVFSTTADGASSPTERMRIDSDGGLAVFSSSIYGGLYSGVSAAAGTSHPTFVGRHSATTTLNGTGSFTVWSNGDVVNSNNSYGAISDIKLKENIVCAGSQWDDLKALQVRKYNFKEETGQQPHTQLGVIAQEVELVSPGLVSESPDRDEDGNDLGTVTKSVNYSVLYMKAVKALQEAIERIEVLEQRLADAGIA